MPADSGAACGDLQSDPHNCGVCGRDCEGGACQEGVCVPLGPGVLATGQAEPGPIVVDDTSVYWADVGVPAILSCSKSGCANAPTVLVQGNAAAATNLVLHGQTLYWGAGSAVYMCSVAGCGGAPTRLAVGGIVGQIAVGSNGDVYVVQRLGHSSIVECPAGDCAHGTTVPWIPGSGVPYAADMFQPIASTVLLDETNLYVLASSLLPSLVTTCVRDACAATSRTLFLAAQGGPAVFAADARNLYVASGNPTIGAEIDLIPKGANPGGGFPEANGTALVMGLVAPSAIAVDDTAIYIADLGEPTEAGVVPSGAGRIGKCRVSGCNGTAKIVQDFVNAPTGIAVDGTNVYWTEQGIDSDPLSGRVVSRPK